MLNLVTGGAGFAGSHLVDYLRLLGRPVRVFRGDVRNFDVCKEQMKDVTNVYHLAAYSQMDETRLNPNLTWDTNVGGSQNIFQCAEMVGARVLAVSTCHVYGYQTEFPITEETIPNPPEIYSKSKLAMERMALEFPNIIISRAFNHFGPRQRPEWLIQDIISNLLRSGKAYLNNPNPTRDFSYVTDIVKGYVRAMDKGASHKTYQFCSERERSNLEIATMIQRLAGGQVFVKNVERPSDIDRSFGTWKRAWEELGWLPTVTFESGLQQTIEWTREHL